LGLRPHFWSFMFDQKIQKLLVDLGARTVSFSYIEQVLPDLKLLKQTYGGFYIPDCDMIAYSDALYMESATYRNYIMLHEIGHWTAHSSRLNRLPISRLESRLPFKNNVYEDIQGYVREECTAEMFGYLYAFELGIENFTDNQHMKRYIASMEAYAVKYGFEIDVDGIIQDALQAVDFVKGRVA
jgi:hypothetical protein